MKEIVDYYEWLCIGCEPPCKLCRSVQHKDDVGYYPNKCVNDGKKCNWILGVYPDHYNISKRKKDVKPED